ncbi:MAG: CCA tRNA nucleotidyltransferase, partial [Candidatus Aenigmatarchaeota archaeon]
YSVNMDISKVKENVLKEINPNNEEKEEIETVCEELEKTANEDTTGLNIDIEFCGSIAKHTWLSGEKDIDMFLLFKKNVSRENLEEYGLRIGKRLADTLGIEYEVAYAEHPYVKMNYKGHDIDVVPAYGIKDPGNIKSSVDRTPHHVKYVMENLDPGFRKDVRLLKKFCKGIGVYGSNLKTRGFSGYLCELLTIEYGKFEDILEASKDWMPGYVVDLENYYDDHSELRQKFESEAMIFVDPVDKGRNVASVLSAENLLRFKREALEFLDSPSDTFFFETEDIYSLDELKDKIIKRNGDVILVSFGAPDVHEDILWPQMRKAKRRLRNVLEKNEFPILNTGEWSNGEECILIFELETTTLPNVEKCKGPTIFDWDNSINFLNRYKEDRILIQDNEWVVEKDREYTVALELLKDFLKREGNELKESGVPKYVAEEIGQKVSIYSGQDIYDVFEKYSDLRVSIKRLFNEDLVSRME